MLFQVKYEIYANNRINECLLSVLDSRKKGYVFFLICVFDVDSEL